MELVGVFCYLSSILAFSGVSLSWHWQTNDAAHKARRVRYPECNVHVNTNGLPNGRDKYVGIRSCVRRPRQVIYLLDVDDIPNSYLSWF